MAISSGANRRTAPAALLGHRGSGRMADAIRPRQDWLPTTHPVEAAGAPSTAPPTGRPRRSSPRRPGLGGLVFGVVVFCIYIGGPHAAAKATRRRTGCFVGRPGGERHPTRKVTDHEPQQGFALKSFCAWGRRWTVPGVVGRRLSRGRRPAPSTGGDMGDMGCLPLSFPAPDSWRKGC